MNYIEWNDIITSKFFNQEMAGREVLIYVNEETINDLGAENHIGVEDFVNCIKVGPFWATEKDIFRKAWQSYEGWRIRQLEYPPYIAYLAFFVLAATKSGDFNPRAYYPRLWELLGEPEKGYPPDINLISEIWDDLEKWSTEDKNEELGRFTSRIRGRRVHVGRPLSQTLLSDDERQYLRQIFFEAELDPADTPSDGVIRRILLNYGENYLEKRTLRLLNPAQTDNLAMANALIEFVLEELAEWNGTMPNIIPSPSNRHLVRHHPHTSRVGLRICLKLERVSGRIISTMRLKSNQHFPDSGLKFKNAGQIFSCKETVPPNWSTKFKISEHPSQEFDAATVDWLKGITLEDDVNKWRARLKPSNVKLFLPGNREGLPGWIESQHLERDCEFIVACHDDSMLEVIEQWGTNHCEKFQRKLYHGLPIGWSLFEGHSSCESCDGVDVLTLSSLLYIRLQGGVKTGRGNTYLKFAPPIIILEGGYGNEYITLNGHEFKRENKSVHSWHLPADAPVGRPLNIEVFRGQENLLRRVIKLEEPDFHRAFDDVPQRDNLGSILKDNVNVPYAVGAIVANIDLSIWDVFPQVLPTYLSDKIAFLGSRPGEIVYWTGGILPEDWQPVWAVAKHGRDRRTVHFCGQPGGKETAPDPSHALDYRRAVRDWKKAILFKKGKKNKNRPSRLIQDKWAEYEEVAKSV
jgi:hypothetical protein